MNRNYEDSWSLKVTEARDFKFIFGKHDLKFRTNYVSIHVDRYVVPGTYLLYKKLDDTHRPKGCTAAAAAAAAASNGKYVRIGGRYISADILESIVRDFEQQNDLTPKIIENIPTI
jgi:hypothetical protein